MAHRAAHRLVRSSLALLALLALGLVAGCGGSSDAGPGETTSERVRPAGPAPAEQGPLVVFLGDSLTAGLGLSSDEAYPALVAARLRERGRAIRIVNAGVSGDTSAGGLRRLDWLLGQAPDVLVVALGANDGLRGISPEATAENLRAIVARTKAAGCRVLLCGMKLPPNYGAEYLRAFEGLFDDVAREHEIALLPFLLEGVGGVAELNQPDGIHPNAAGQRRVAENVLPPLLELVTGLE